jgi:hypothetical protein
MRMPRVRLTVRQLMIAAAVAALVLTTWVGLQRRAAHLRRSSLCQSLQANRWELLLTESSVNGPLAAAILDKVHWHDGMAARYERAARLPWLPVETAPPAPEVPAELATKYQLSANTESPPP